MTFSIDRHSMCRSKPSHNTIFIHILTGTERQTVHECVCQSKYQRKLFLWFYLTWHQGIDNSKQKSVLHFSWGNRVVGWRIERRQKSNPSAKESTSLLVTILTNKIYCSKGLGANLITTANHNHLTTRSKFPTGRKFRCFADEKFHKIKLLL